jgi:hypothetical protein
MSQEERHALDLSVAHKEIAKPDLRPLIETNQPRVHLQRWSTQAFGCSPRSCASEG